MNEVHVKTRICNVRGLLNLLPDEGEDDGGSSSDPGGAVKSVIFSLEQV